jgi:hypothetical protein
MTAVKVPAASANRPVPPVIVCDRLHVVNTWRHRGAGRLGRGEQPVPICGRECPRSSRHRIRKRTDTVFLGRESTELRGIPSPLRWISSVAGGVKTPIVVPEMSPLNGSEAAAFVAAVCDAPVGVADVGEIGEPGS